MRFYVVDYGYVRELSLYDVTGVREITAEFLTTNSNKRLTWANDKIYSIGKDDFEEIRGIIDHENENAARMRDLLQNKHINENQLSSIVKNAIKGIYGIRNIQTAITSALEAYPK